MLDANRYLGVVLRIIVVLWAGFCPPAFSADKLAIEWRPLFAGVDHAAIHAGVNPDLPLVIQVLRIDLSAEGIGFFTTPSNEDRPLETDSQPTDAFLMEYGLQAAINAAFFSPCCAAVSEPKNVIGLAISNGQYVSPNDWSGGEAGSAILGITPNNRAGLYFADRDVPEETFQNAVAGGPMLLKDGQLLVQEGGPRHPRTAVGLSSDGRFMYWMTIDGRQPGYSLGTTHYQTAEWLLRVGASQGMNLDGGGSTTMVIADPQTKAKVLNRPSGGRPRFISSSIGMYADPLKMESRMPVYVAHRGASWDAPENTLASVNLAWQQGADAAEIDVYLSSDKRIVVIHDKDTKRTAGVDLKVEQTTADELRKLDVGRLKGPAYTGQNIPFLEEIIAALPAKKKLYVEVKSDVRILPHLMEVIDAEGKRDRIVLISFDLDVVTALKKLAREVPTYWIVSAEKNKVTQHYVPYSKTLIEKAKQAGLEGLALHYGPLNAAYVQAVRAAGLDIYVWTINEPKDAMRMLEMGIERITTDRPQWLKQQVEALQKTHSGVHTKKND